jgi:hypothetical protein
MCVLLQRMYRHGAGYKTKSPFELLPELTASSLLFARVQRMYYISVNVLQSRSSTKQHDNTSDSALCQSVGRLCILRPMR